MSGARINLLPNFSKLEPSYLIVRALTQSMAIAESPPLPPPGADLKKPNSLAAKESLTHQTNAL